MIANLRNLEIYTCASLLFGRCLRGHNGTCEPDIGNLKKGIRYCNDLNWHEAWFRVLCQVGLIDAVRDKCAKAGNPELRGSMLDNARRARGYQQQYLEQAQKRLAGDQYIENDKKSARQYGRMAEIYEMLMPHEVTAKAMFDSLPKNRSKNVDWKDLRSVQFYAYDREQNCFAECDLQGK